MTEHPPCPYCAAPTHVQDSSVVYGKSYGSLLICTAYPRCDAFVGINVLSGLPLGRLANAALREWKKAAHAKFDPLWKYKKERQGARDARNQGYRWLAHKLGLSEAACHIGMFDEAGCRDVIRVCDEVYAQYPALQAYFYELNNDWAK